MKKMKKRTLFGLSGSALWAALGVALFFQKSHELAVMKLNEIGDFLAGWIAPLAFLWLIIGYFQQGEELNQNTAALLAQQKEMEKQIQETALLVAQTERHAKATEDLFKVNREKFTRELNEKRLEKRPKFASPGGGWKSDSAELNYTNVGGSARDLTAEIDNGALVSLRPVHALEKGERIRIDIKFSDAKEYAMKIRCSDIYNDEVEFNFRVNRVKHTCIEIFDQAA